MLGVARMLLLPAVDYAVAEAEYGKHWNFFLALAAVHIAHQPIAALQRFACRDARRMWFFAVAALVLAGGYECALNAGLAEYVLQPARHGSLLFQNREGVCSLPGLLAIHCAGVALGAGTRDLPMKTLVRALAVLCAATWMLLLTPHNTLLAPSRRLVCEWHSGGSDSLVQANAAYLLWTLAINSIVWLGCALRVRMTRAQAHDHILSAPLIDRSTL